MEQKKIEFWDLHRWLAGDTPSWFLLEVAIRAIFVYFILLITLRLMGRRVAAQMTVSELAIVVTLGAAVGVPMQAPDRGMLGAVVILAIAAGVERLLTWSSFRSRRAEVITQGDVIVIVEDSRIQIDQLKAAGLSHERLFAVLRGRGVEHLGQVRRVYAEASGDFSILLYKKPWPGLSVLPTFDEKLRRSELSARDCFACLTCGEMRECKKRPEGACDHCGSLEWTEAVSEVEEVEEHPERARGES